jgi:uncharacterized protein YciI
MIPRTVILFILIFLFSGTSVSWSQDHVQNTKGQEKKSEIPIYCIIKHSPGPNWKEGVSFLELPVVGDHINYMRKQLDNGMLVMGGPYADFSGGMMICNTTDVEVARKIAESDPAVKSGYLKFEIKLWRVPMSSVDRIPDELSSK